PFIDPELEIQIQKMVENLAAQDAAKEAKEDSFLHADQAVTAMPVYAVQDPSEMSQAEGSEGNAPADGTDHRAGDDHEPGTALVKGDEDHVTWASAARAKDFFDHLADARQQGPLASFWRSRRGDVYLAVAVVLVAVVIRWGIWSNHS